MPRYEFFCHACKKSFAKILSLVDYEEGDVLCPHSGSKEVPPARYRHRGLRPIASDEGGEMRSRTPQG
jgi:putative FmdB family regulatory protein